MSLKEAVLDVVESMEDDAKDAEPIVRMALKSYAQQLRAVCKAAGDSPAPAALPGLASAANMFYSPELQHRMAIEEAKKEFRNPNGLVPGAPPPRAVQAEEQFDGDMVEIIGGPAGSAHGDLPCYHPIDPNVPTGAYIPLAGGVYQLTQQEGHRQLVFNEQQTQRVAGELQEKKSGLILP